VTSPPSPFTALGLRPDPALTDDDIRDAWRQVAAATHPDREDGGDPAAYAAAGQARDQLRTSWGRAEARADLAEGITPGRARPAPGRHPGIARAAVLPARIRHGRPARLAVRVLAAAVLAWLAWLALPGSAAAAGTAALLATWLVLTGRGDLAPPPGR
jgi:curved DNA-binding protein CbpA